MPEFNVRGFRPEPDSPKHWGFEDKLKSSLVQITTDDMDLREYSSPRHNQRNTSSCVANAVVKALEIKRILKHGHEAHVDLSRMAVYFLARELMFPPETHEDDGTYISHAFDVLRRFGVPPEADWPWDLAKVNTAPSWRAMRKAYLHKIQGFYKIRSTGQKRVDEVALCIQSGYPVVFGTTTGSNWGSYRKGDVLIRPDKVDGRHATVLLGVKDGKFIGENSWGTNWGDDGFYLMDPAVVAHDDSRDFWVAQAGWEDLT